MSFLKRLFGKKTVVRPRVSLPSAPPALERDPQTAVDTSKAGLPVDCDGVEWNGAAQKRFLHEILPRADQDRFHRLLSAPGFPSNPHCNPADAAVLFAVIDHFEPSRIMEVGCGQTTRVIRAAKDAAMMPGELIAIDPEPRIDISELVDAHLAEPVQDVPVDDFTILQEGELVFIDSTHCDRPGSDVDHLFTEILPNLADGVLVGLHGIRLPRNYAADELRQGFDEQIRLLEFLRVHRPEILFSGGWLAEHAPQALRDALPETCRRHPLTAFWMRIRK